MVPAYCSIIMWWEKEAVSMYLLSQLPRFHQQWSKLLPITLNVCYHPCSLCVYMVLRPDPRPSWVLGTHSTAELHPQSPAITLMIRFQHVNLGDTKTLRPSQCNPQGRAESSHCSGIVLLERTAATSASDLAMFLQGLSGTWVAGMLFCGK